MVLRIFSIFLFCMGCSGAVMASQDVIAQEKETWRRISTAGLQRMLAQRIEQANCYVMTGIDAQRYSASASEAIDTFDTNLQALITGSDDLGLSPETDPEILTQLAQMQDLWRLFSPAARQVMSGDTHAIPVRQLINFDRPLLDMAEATTQAIKSTYSAKLVARQKMANTINVAARQRMLAVRMAKSFCYIALGLGRDVMMEDLTVVISEFEIALKAMEFGDFDLEIVDPPNLSVMSALMDVRTAWTDLKPHLENAISNPDALVEQLTFIAEKTEALKDLSGAVVQQYLK